MRRALIEIGREVVIGMTLAACCAAVPTTPAWAERTPAEIAENIRKMQERFRENDRADAERLQKALADAAERARKKEDERLLGQVEAAEKLGPNLSPTGVMVKDGAGNWVDADRSGRPLPPPEPPRKPLDPEAKEAAEKKVREAFERDRRKALEDQAKRDKEAEDKAAERRARYGLKPGEDAGPTGIMIKVGGNWVPAGLDGKPLPAPRPKVDPRRLGAVPVDPAEAEKARQAAEARVRAAFDRDRQQALDDAAKRDRAADDKAGERLLKYGLLPAGAPVQNTLSARPVVPAPAPTVSALTYAIVPPPAPKPVQPAPASAVSALSYAIAPQSAPLRPLPEPAPAVSALSYSVPTAKPAPRSVLELPRPTQVQAAPARQATQAIQATQLKAPAATPAQAAAAAVRPTSALAIGR